MSDKPLRHSSHPKRKTKIRCPNSTSSFLLANFRPTFRARRLICSAQAFTREGNFNMLRAVEFLLCFIIPFTDLSSFPSPRFLVFFFSFLFFYFLNRFDEFCSRGSTKKLKISSRARGSTGNFTSGI